MIVNDDSSMLVLIQTLLEQRGLSTMLVRRGPLAVPTIQAEQPDLVVLDIRMEEPDTGWKILAQLRSDPKMGNIPVIVCSANLSSGEQTKEREAKVFMLPIPFDLDDLFSTVAEAVDLVSPGRL